MARFFNLTPDISVQYWLEFLGKKAMIVHDKDWSLTAEEYFVDKRPGVNGELSETSRLYLQQPSAAFEREIVNSLLHLIGVNEDFCKFQFKRENGARMVHFRPSDENPVLLGFGRLNPRNGKKCDKNFSETFVDRKPGTVFTNYKGEDGQVWEDFKPVYLKIKPADGLPTPPARPVPAADQPASDGEKEKIVPVIVKTQTFGSRSAVEKEIGKISVPNLKIQILDSGIGALTENDIKLARASGAIVVGFQVKIEKAAADLAIKNQTTYGVFDIIYKLNEWLEAELGRRRPRIEVEIIIGSAKIIKLFSQTKNKQVVGGLVLEGKISNRRAVRVKRRGADLGAGEILELQQQQTAVKEVEKGKQFGALVETRHALAAGDVLEILEIERK